MKGEMKMKGRMRDHIVMLGLLLVPVLAWAEHSWGPYHWARAENPFALPIVNSTTGTWATYVDQAMRDWTGSGVVTMTSETGDTTSKVRRQCSAPSGKVRICNLAYGQNGWLGIAGISVDARGHIIKGYTKLNDTYFSWDYYNNEDWKQSVTCQELGHDIGLAHQDENFNNDSLLSCMDYQVPPFRYPNSHDYAQLNEIYGHLDAAATNVVNGSGTGRGTSAGVGRNQGDVNGHNGDIGWGISLGRRGQQETFMRIDLDGTRHITHVTWVIGY